MDVAARRNRTLFRWIMVTLLAVLLPFAALAQPAAGQADSAEAATAAEEAQCRACSYERIDPRSISAWWHWCRCWWWAC
jgi:hypothetical protein